MPEAAHLDAEENRIETFFADTPHISPSSLAFFVSGFAKTTQDLRAGFEHVVSVRSTEMDYKEKLFEKTQQIVDAVESFMDIKLPFAVLHSVALPNFDYEIGSSYGFNFYR